MIRATIRVDRQTEFLGEFEGETLEECIGQAIFEARGPRSAIVSEKATVVETDQLAYNPPIKVVKKLSDEVPMVVKFRQAETFGPSDQRE